MDTYFDVIAMIPSCVGENSAWVLVLNNEPLLTLIPGIRRDMRHMTRYSIIMINVATALDDLRALSSNRLHALHGDRRGLCSVSVNDQWRICFRFCDGDALVREAGSDSMFEFFTADGPGKWGNSVYVQVLLAKLQCVRVGADHVFGSDHLV